MPQYTKITDITDKNRLRRIKYKIKKFLEKNPKCQIQDRELYASEDDEIYFYQSRNYGGSFTLLSALVPFYTKPIEEKVRDAFLEKYQYPNKKSFQAMEREFLLTLTIEQRKTYKKLMDEIHAFEFDKEIKLIRFAKTRNGFIYFD